MIGIDTVAQAEDEDEPEGGAGERGGIVHVEILRYRFDEVSWLSILGFAVARCPMPDAQRLEQMRDCRVIARNTCQPLCQPQICANV